MNIDNSLPNEEQLKELCELFCYAFTDIRAYLTDGKNIQAEELADIFHNIPQEMYGYGLWNLPSMLENLQRYQDKYGGTNYVGYLKKIFGSDYV